MAYCYCCDRRLSTDPCSCSTWYCRRCILCADHCRCADPQLVRDEDLDDEADEPVVLPRKTDDAEGDHPC